MHDQLTHTHLRIPPTAYADLGEGSLAEVVLALAEGCTRAQERLASGLRVTESHAATGHGAPKRIAGDVKRLDTVVASLILEALEGTRVCTVAATTHEGYIAMGNPSPKQPGWSESGSELGSESDDSTKVSHSGIDGDASASSDSSKSASPSLSPPPTHAPAGSVNTSSAGWRNGMASAAPPSPSFLPVAAAEAVEAKQLKMKEAAEAVAEEEGKEEEAVASGALGDGDTDDPYSHYFKPPCAPSSAPPSPPLSPPPPRSPPVERGPAGPQEALAGGSLAESSECSLAEPSDQHVRYAVVLNPLDGASNADAGASVGTIWGIYQVDSSSNPASASSSASAIASSSASASASSSASASAIASASPLSSTPGSPHHVLRAGRHLLAAGYVIYGAATLLTLSLGSGVDGFTLHPTRRLFLMTRPELAMPKIGRFHSINHGHAKGWNRSVIEHVEVVLARTKSLRYIGTMIADLHRTLLYGGIFLYPPSKTRKQGKLKVLTELAPMAFLFEQAGGTALTGEDASARILDLTPTTSSQCSPCYMGSAGDVADFVRTVQAPVGVCYSRGRLFPPSRRRSRASHEETAVALPVPLNVAGGRRLSKEKEEEEVVEEEEEEEAEDDDEEDEGKEVDEGSKEMQAVGAAKDLDEGSIASEASGSSTSSAGERARRPVSPFERTKAAVAGMAASLGLKRAGKNQLEQELDRIHLARRCD